MKLFDSTTLTDILLSMLTDQGFIEMKQNKVQSIVKNFQRGNLNIFVDISSQKNTKMNQENFSQHTIISLLKSFVICIALCIIITGISPMP